MNENEVQEMKEGILDLNEVVRAKIEPMMDSMRMDLMNLTNQKHFFFQDSTIIESNDQVAFLFREIHGFTFATKIQLLYRGSRDGWLFKDFHAKSDNKGPTLTLIRTKTGRLCGGFTKVPW